MANGMTRQYIGARYVPIFADPVEWDDERTYEPLMMVQHQGETYMTKQYVPVGIPLPTVSEGQESNDYWVHMSNWNAQVEGYREEVLRYAEEVLAFDGRIDTLEDDLPLASFDSTNTVAAAIGGLQDQIGSGFSAASSVADAISDIETENTFKVTTFDTVALMKASDSLYEGEVVRTKGFVSKGDGGAAFYEIRATGTANELDVIACGDLYAHYVYNGTCTPEQFGAYGNGVNDDHDAIMKAFEYGSVVFNEYKNYATAELLIDIDGDFYFDGNGCKLTKIGEVEEGVIHIQPTADNLKITVENVKINCARVACFGVWVRHIRDDADIDYKENIMVSNVEVYNADNVDMNYSCGGVGVYTGTEKLVVENCYIHDIYKTAYVEAVIASRGITVNNAHGYCNIEGNTIENLYPSVDGLDSDAISIFGTAKKAYVQNNLIVNPGSRFMKFQTRNVDVLNNKMIVNNVNPTYRVGIDFQTGAGNVIGNECVFDSTPTATSDSCFIQEVPNETVNSIIIADNKVTGNANSIRDFIHLYPSVSGSVDCDIKGNYVDCSEKVNSAGSYVLVSPSANLTFDAFRVNVHDCTIKNGSVVLVGSGYLTSSDFNNVLEIIIQNCKCISSYNAYPISTTVTPIKNIWLENNDNIYSKIASNDFDLKKVKHARCYFNTDGSSGGIINAPSGMMTRYVFVEVEQIDTGETNVKGKISGGNTLGEWQISRS